MSVFNVLNEAIYNALSADSQLTSLLSGTAAIYYLQAPDGAELDYVVFSHQGGGPENITASDMRNQLVFVRGYSAVGPAKAGSIDARCSAILHGKALNVSGYTNFWLAREDDLSLVMNAPDGNQVWMAGAIYRVRLDN